MKIIHITGYAKSGKTTFAAELVRRLSEMGNVAAVKHLGHHEYALEAGRDTTKLYEQGAAWSAGIDSDKAVVAIRNQDLEEVLELVCDAGADFAVVEGFKKRPFPKIIQGDLEAENCVLRNPAVEDVVASLDRFEDYYTIKGLVAELKANCSVSKAGAILTFNGIVREWTGEEHTEHLDFDDTVDTLINAIRKEMESVPGILGVRFHHRKGRLYAGDDITYLAVLAEHRQEAFAAVSHAIDRLKTELHDTLPGGA